MNMKELLSQLSRQFFILTTLITIGVGVLGLAFQPDERFGYGALFLPVVYALAGLLPTAVMYSKKELSVKSVIIRKIIQAILIEIIVLAIIFGKNIFDPQYTLTAVGVAVCILVIFALAHGVSVLWEYMDARKMNEDLEKFLKKNEVLGMGKQNV